MQEIKNQFTGGKMNKDLDERLVPKGEYRDAMNIQVSTSEESDVGAVQNILGNIPGCIYDPLSQNPLNKKNPITTGSYTVGSISDEKNDSLYWLVAGPGDDFDINNFQPISLANGGFLPNTVSFKDMIMRTNSDLSVAPSGCEPVFVDKYKWCSTLDPFQTSTITDTLVFDDTSLYSNVTAGMQATGYSGGTVVWGPRLVNSVGGLKTISVNYQSNAVTTPIPAGNQSVFMRLRTFDSYVPGSVTNSVYNEQFLNAQHNPAKGASNNTYLPNSNQIQFVIPASSAIPSSLGIGSTITTPFGYDVTVDSILTVTLFDEYLMGVGVLPNSYHLITTNLPLGTNFPPSSSFISSVLTSNIVNTLGRSQVNNYDAFPANVNSAGAVTYSAGNTICVPPTSQQWLNEIYQVLFEPGTTNLTGFNFEIDNSVGAGTLWPPNSCIDPQSVIDPLGSVQSGNGVFSFGPPIVYNTCYNVVQCNDLTTPVFPSSMNTNSLELSFFIPSQGAGPIEAIYLDESVEMQNVDAVCFESDRVLNFNSDRLITGINIIDDMLFWTDNFSEPKKINISRSIEGTDPVGDTHTAVINSATGLSLSNYHPIREEHVTVIKKAPKSALTMDLKTARDPRKNYSAIVTISDETNLNFSGLWQQRGAPGPPLNASYPYDFSTFTIDEGNNIMYIRMFSDLDGNSNFELNGWKIGSKVVLKEYDSAGQPPQIPIQDYTIKGEIVAWDYTNSNGVTIDANTFSTTPAPTVYATGPALYCKVAIKITSIARTPQVPTGSSVSLNYAIDLFDESEKLFEFKLPRFSYRYKYEDGEYSTFAPFTSVAFIPGAFDYHAKKGYNLGMTNNLSHLFLRDYITADIPLDVVQIDLLYKEDGSPNVYIVESLRPDSEATIPVFSQLYTSWALNSFEINKDNIKAALPANQLLRPWDNVPKKALAQEVTGSRIVYGNYEQNYDLVAGGLQYNPLFQVIPVEDDSNIKSIKSLREYQLGVVFTDKYGRETPVISNNSGTFKVDKANAIKKNKLKIKLTNSIAPLNMEYFKFYIKETSGEYYNLAMDRYYNAEDGNIWVSFASADRNKIDIDSFIILKKGVDSEELVEDPARFKVIAIENEAPDFIKIKKNIVSDKASPDANGANSFLTGANKVPTVGSRTFSIGWWDAINGVPAHSNTAIKNIHESTGDVEYYFQITNDDGTQSSTPMRISEIELSSVDDFDLTQIQNATANIDWAITLEKPFGTDILKFTDSPNDAANVTKIEDGNRCVFWSYKKENSAEFDGRFFVKIFEEDVFTEYVVNNPTAVSDTRSVVSLMKQKIYSFNKFRHNFAWQNPSGPLPGPSGSSNFTVSKNNAPNTPSLLSYIIATNTTGLSHGDSGTEWISYAAFFRAINLHRGQPSFYGGTNSFGDHGINMRKEFETMDLHSPGNVTGNNELEFEDVWFVDGTVSQGRFYGNSWGTGYTTTNYNPSGLSVTTGVSTVGQIEIGFGGIQPSSGGSDTDFPWTKDTDDPDFYDLSENNNYNSANGPSDFATALSTAQQKWGWLEDPSGQIYKSTGISNYNLLRHEASPDIDEQYNQARGVAIASNYSGLNPQYVQSTFYRPDNYSKNYNLTFTDHADTSAPIAFNPYKYGTLEDDGGLIIPLVVQSVSATPHNNEIVVTSLTGEDLSPGEFGNQKIYVGMVWDTTDVATRTAPSGTVFDPAWTADSATSGYGAVVSEIDFASNTLRFKQYNPNAPTQAFPSLSGTLSPAVGNIIYVKQFGMNGISRNSAKNINKFNNGVGFTDTAPGVDAVGYTLDIKDISGSVTEVQFPRFPAIFETEPKDQADLDLYYEISSNIPTVLSMDNIESILPVGSAIEIRSQDYSVGNLNTGVIPIDDGITILNNTFNGTGNEIVISANLGFQNIAGGLNAGVGGDKLLVYRSDGSTIEIEILNMTNTGVSPPLTVFELNKNLLQQNVTSTWHNCYSFGNGVESNRIRDNFNLPFIKNGVKVSTTLDQEYKQERRKHGLIYSGIYNSNSGVNNLNQFIQAEKITKDINPIYGSIQKLHSGWGQSGDLVTLCEDRVLKILANKDALFNADGDTNVTATDKVLGTATPYSGEFGISENPESFASEAYRAYFTDKVRGTVMRLSMDGLTPISEHGMKDWFRDNLKLNSKLIGSYDDKKDEYNITLPITTTGHKDINNNIINAKTVSFKENVRGWVSFKSFVPEHANSCANEYYTYLGGELWKHHVEQINSTTGLEEKRNTFYGNFMPSSLNVIFNDVPGVVKTFHTLNYEGTQSKIDEFRNYDTIDHTTGLVRDNYDFTDNDQIGYYNLKDIPGWYVNSIVTDLEEGGVPEFIKKEGKWFNYIRGKTGSVIDSQKMTNNVIGGYNNADFSFQGIARALTVFVGQILGCMDSTQFNYNPLATGPDPNNPCIPFVYGCTDSNASAGYNSSANTDDGSCEYYGCMDSLASNYNSNATSDPNNECIYSVQGCTDPLALNYNSNATVDDGSCTYCVYGCMNGAANNFDPNATCDDGSCTYNLGGCTDPLAINYDPSATVDDGSCIYGGCTDPLACNYDASATQDDGSCTYCNDNTSTNVMNFDGGTCNNGCIYCEQPTVINSSVTANSITLEVAPAPVSANTAATIEYKYFLFPSNATVSPYPSGNPLQSVTTTNTTKTFGGLDPNEHYSVSIIATCQSNPIVQSGSLYVGFVTSTSVVSGCTDPNACNYAASATIDDGSCEFTSCAGCTSPTASNYDPSATIDDGSCIPCVYGCTDSTQSNYNPAATCDDGSCIAAVYGCTHPFANNQDPNANTDDGSCQFVGCTDPTASNYSFGDNTLSNVVTQTNDLYLPPNSPAGITSGVAIDSGTCNMPTYGCTNPVASNYNPNATNACNSNDPAQGGSGSSAYPSLGYDPQFNNECCICPCTDCCVDSLSWYKTLSSGSRIPAYYGPGATNSAGSPLPAGDRIEINLSGVCNPGGQSVIGNTTAGCNPNAYNYEIHGPNGNLVWQQNVTGSSTGVGLSSLNTYIDPLAIWNDPNGGDGTYTITFNNESMNCMTNINPPNAGPQYCTSNSSITFDLQIGCMISFSPNYNPNANIVGDPGVYCI